MLLANSGAKWFVLMACALAAIASSLNADVILTGASVFSTDASGSFTPPNVWNTVPGDKWYNIYFTAANSGIGGAFLNTGDDGNTNLSIDLSAGTDQFYLFADPGLGSHYEAINLFFSGNTGQPTLSAFAPLETSLTQPLFTANTSASTLALNGSTSVAASGQLSAVIGNHQVTMTDYSWSVPSVYGLDRVSEFDSIPDGINDFVGTLTLKVTAVPEPAGPALLALGTAFFMLRRIKGTCYRLLGRPALSPA